jgi:hypothetical protein
VSVLEFVSSIKWPVTVLLLAFMATVLLKRNPGTGKSVGAWFSRRNLRLNVAGQEFEATVAETQGSIDVATTPDRDLAEVAVNATQPEQEQRASTHELADQEVENARREAVGRVAQNAVRLGWLWARGDRGASEPVAVVSWGADGQPRLRVIAREDTPAEVALMAANLGHNVDSKAIEALLSQLQHAHAGEVLNRTLSQFRSRPHQGRGVDDETDAT